MKSNGSMSTEWAKVLYFVLEKVLFYTEVKFSYFNNLFGNVFQTSGVIVVLTLYSMRNSDAKKVFQLPEKVFSGLAFHWKPGFQNFHVISMF